MLKPARAFPDNLISELTIPILFIMDGLIFIFLAIWAYEIGLDPNTAWGRSRFFLLFIGLSFVLVSILLVLFKRRKANFFTPVLESKTARLLLSLAHIWLFIILVYVWFITYGNWTTWNRTTNYYDQLANAFNQGQLNIHIDPGAALLASPNPYDTAHRPAFNSDIWDMSLYKGKIYFYWGPLPAVIIAPIKFFLGKKITDNFLVCFFFSGLLIFNSLILLKLWKKFFKELPEWYLLICILLTGFVLPVLWSVNSPRVYEAAIGASQFFLMGGIFFALSAFDREVKIDKLKLFLTGLFWACSVGSRAINAFPIMFLTGLLIFWIVKNMLNQTSWPKSVLEITALVAPLIIGAAGLGWYNWARFDSLFEFGFRYQITIHNLNELSSLLFQPGYFLPNLYAYVFQPFELASKFPYIYPGVPALEIINRLDFATPSIYFTGRMTGLLFCAPFLLLGLIHLHPVSKHTPVDDSPGTLLSYDFVVYLLAGAFLVGFASLMLFFFAQMRYFVDVISPLTLLGIIGYWKVVSLSNASKSARSRIFLGFANLLMVFTICASLLLAFSSDYDRLKTFNPVLFEKIANSLTIQK